ncbi:hypothetical protein [Stenotrophomonas sp.]|uniref:hypothetical protein n=1 Tax=Stenotrophomonas sp. TaxID=69392 RepID=UPI002FC877CE
MCRPHKAAWIALALAGLVIAVASVAAWHVWTLQQGGQPMPHWVQWLRRVGPGDYYARRSGLGAMASVYYSLVVLTFPLGIVVGYGLLTYRRDGRLNAWVDQKRNLKGLLACWFSIVFFPLVGVGFLLAASGSNFRKLKVADDPMALLSNGWMPYLLTGIVVALSPCILRGLLAQRR